MNLLIKPCSRTIWIYIIVLSFYRVAHSTGSYQMQPSPMLNMKYQKSSQSCSLDKHVFTKEGVLRQTICQKLYDCFVLQGKPIMCYYPIENKDWGIV